MVIDVKYVATLDLTKKLMYLSKCVAGLANVHAGIVTIRMRNAQF